MTTDKGDSIGAVSNIMLGVTDLSASLSFYRDQLGFQVHFESPGFAFLNGGSIVIALSEPLSGASENQVGATEIVISVSDIHVAYDELKSRGIEFLNEPRAVTPNEHAANFCDPDGHRLSIFGPANETE